MLAPRLSFHSSYVGEFVSSEDGGRHCRPRRFSEGGTPLFVLQPLGYRHCSRLPHSDPPQMGRIGDFLAAHSYQRNLMDKFCTDSG